MGLFAKYKVGAAMAGDQLPYLEQGEYRVRVKRFWYEESGNPESQHVAFIKLEGTITETLTRMPGGNPCPATGAPLPASNEPGSTFINMWSVSVGPALGSAKKCALALAGVTESAMYASYTQDTGKGTGTDTERAAAWDWFLTNCVADDGLEFEGTELHVIAQARKTKKGSPFTSRIFKAIP